MNKLHILSFVSPYNVIQGPSRYENTSSAKTLPTPRVTATVTGSNCPIDGDGQWGLAGAVRKSPPAQQRLIGGGGGARRSCEVRWSDAPAEGPSPWAATALIGETELTSVCVDLRIQVAAMKLDKVMVIVVVLLSSVYCQDSDEWTGLLEQVREFITIVVNLTVYLIWPGSSAEQVAKFGGDSGSARENHQKTCTATQKSGNPEETLQ